MRYVSTRGEAAPLDFVEVMLAGLARDGGLYVPESWPALDRETIAGFAGKPYAEVAVDVIRPFVGGSITDADLARMVREAYGGFRHPGTAPLVQLASSLFVLELFHGATLAHNHCRGDVRRHGWCCGGGVQGERAGRRGGAVPARTHFRCAAAHDDHRFR